MAMEFPSISRTQPTMALGKVLCPKLSTVASADSGRGDAPLLQNLPAVSFGTSKNRFVNLTIGILGHHRAQSAVGAHRASPMTDREITAGKAVFVSNQTLWSFDEVPAGSAGF